MVLYGVTKDGFKNFVIGGGIGIGINLLSKIFPFFSLGIPIVAGLSTLGNYLVVLICAPFIEEFFFRGAFLGFLTEKKPLPKFDDIKRGMIFIVLSFFVIGFILINLLWQSGIVYSILAVMTLVIYALWDKIKTLNLNFELAVIISSLSFSFYHLKVYAGEIAASAILSASGAFFTAFVVGVIAAYLLRWRKDLMCPIGIHLVFNGLILFAKFIIA